MLGMSGEQIVFLLISVGIVLVATVLHEVAHAACAYVLGDSTAKERGRLTLNPFAHLDPVGSVLLPLLMGLAGGPIFAFAKPVPYNPRRLRKPVVDEVLVAFAGPACNLVQALVGTVVFRVLMGMYEGGVGDPQVMYVVVQTVASYVYLNLMLMFFNLIPLPPLDGSAIVSPLLRGKARMWYYQVQRYALPVLLAVMYLVPMVLHVNPLGTYLAATAGRLTTVLLGF